MGIASSSSPSFESIVTKSITAADALTQLAELTTLFLGGASPAATASRSRPTSRSSAGAAQAVAPARMAAASSIVGDSPILQQLVTAMGAAETLAENTYNGQFSPTLPVGQADKGVVLNYVSNPGNLTNVVEQIQNDFTNWNLIISPDQALQLTKTIAIEVNAQLGAVGSSTGSYSVDANTISQWAVSYGLFTQDDQGDQALVYAFCANEQAA